MMAADGIVFDIKGSVGTDPVKRAFYGGFCVFNPLNDLGIG